MELNRLKKIRNARDNFIRKLLERTDGAFSDKLQAILNAVERNWDDINTINRQILEKVGISDIEKEIEENEEKSLEIAIKLQKLRLSQTAEGNFTLPGAQREQGAEGNSTEHGLPREQGAEGNATEPGPPREQTETMQQQLIEKNMKIKELRIAIKNKYSGELIPTEEVQTGELVCFMDGYRTIHCGYAFNFDKVKRYIAIKDGKLKEVPERVKIVWRSFSIKTAIQNKNAVSNSCFDFDENIFTNEAAEMMKKIPS